MALGFRIPDTCQIKLISNEIRVYLGQISLYAPTVQTQYYEMRVTTSSRQNSSKPWVSCFLPHLIIFIQP